ncbi:hypothetical protein, partial [Bacillus phage SPG24]
CSSQRTTKGTLYTGILEALTQTLLLSLSTHLVRQKSILRTTQYSI